jgi:hypothetical protein
VAVGRDLLGGEMTGRCGSGQAEAPGDGGAWVGAVHVASGIARALVSAQANRARMVRSACNQPARSVGPAAAAAPLVLGRPFSRRVRHAGRRASSAAQIAGSGCPEAGPDPPARRGALSCEAPLGCPVVTSEPANVHSAVLTRRRLVLAGLVGRRRTQRDDRVAVALLTAGRPPRGHSPCRARQPRGRNPRAFTASAAAPRSWTRPPWPSPSATPAAGSSWCTRPGGACRRRSSRPPGC